MLYNGQTLVHKKTNKLARLNHDREASMWAWNIGKKTAFISENGKKFADDISNYTHIKDELGQPYAHPPKEGQFVDETAKKYLISKAELAKMRRKKLEELEADILDRMAGNVKMNSCIIRGGVKRTYSCDVPKKMVHCPFSDVYPLFRDYFMKRRGAGPLYRSWSSISKRYVDGPMVFRHTDGQVWIYEYSLSELKVIEPGSISTLSSWGGLAS